MTVTPLGLPIGLPTSSCADAPPPLSGGGAAPSTVRSPLQAPTAPTATATAALGASSLTTVPSTGLFSTAPVMVTTGANAAPTAAPVAPVSTPGAPAPVAATPTPAAAPARLTSLAPGGTQSDANLVEATLGVLRQSPSGAQLVDRLMAVGARINVISDAEFQRLGHGDAHAFFDPKQDAMFLRRSDLADTANTRFAAVALAHEGTHLLDDAGNVAAPFIQQAARQVQVAGGPETPKGAAVQQQALFELTMIKEARAFVFAGQVAKDLGVTTPATDPTSVAAAGDNDQATYAKVWQSLLKSGYNPEHRAAAVRSF